MGVVQALSAMHREAVEQIRAGDHSTFLVGFLTTSTMLEISGLANRELRLDEYAQAAAQTIAQYAPLDRVRLELIPDELPPFTAAVGMPADDTTELPHAGRVAVDGAGTVVLSAYSLPAPLAEAGFLEIAAGHIAGGFRHLLEDERRRRRAAVADTLALVASLDEQWGQQELETLARALATLPGVRAAQISVGANRLAGVLTASSGVMCGHVVERVFTIDERVEAEVTTAYVGEPDDDQLRVLDDVLCTLAANLSRIEQNIRLTSEAETDQLTGVANRRRVGRSLVAARAMSDRRQQPFAVLLFDLDHFKSVNDRLGHAVGDAVLIRFAELLRGNVRPFDTVARWGGEEFLLLCPDCGMEGAIAVSRRVIEQCPDALADVLPPEVRQTTSVGIAVYPDHGGMPETVIRSADEALYRAKREGRNRWSAAGDLAATR